MKATILASTFAAGALAQSGAWGQCGGNGWSGATSCISGYTCTYVNDWYRQCQSGTAAPTTTAAATTLVTSTKTAPPATTTTTATTSGKFKWFGVNEAGGEFGDGIFPGRWGTEFTFPDTNTIQVCHLPLLSRYVFGSGY